MKNKNNNLSKNKTIRRVALWGGVVLVLGGAVFGVVKFAATPSGNGLTASAIDAVSSLDWWKGSKDSKIILIEYSDFQCPACATYAPMVKQLSQEFGDKILFVYRHFPLPQHKNAEPAARAAEAAGKQGKFWEMHDIIFENQKIWSDQKDAESIFVKYAESLFIDISKFKADFDSKETKNKVESDYQSGIRASVNSTPTFFLNGQKIQNPRSYEEFKNTVLSGA